MIEEVKLELAHRGNEDATENCSWYERQGTVTCVVETTSIPHLKHINASIMDRPIYVEVSYYRMCGSKSDVRHDRMPAGFEISRYSWSNILDKIPTAFGVYNYGCLFAVQNIC
jgi:hypothetical protein